MNYQTPLLRISNGELVGQLFSQCERDDRRIVCGETHDVVWMLSRILVIKFVLMFLSFGIKVPAGFFMPSMAVGAIIGRITGEVLEWFVIRHSEWDLFQSCPVTGPCVIPGVYAIVGAAATLCGVTRMTVSLVIIMFELTGSLAYVLPIMVSIMVAKWMSDSLSSESLYDKLINVQGHPYLDHKKTISLKKNTMDLVETECETLELRKDYSFNELSLMLDRLKHMRYADDGGFPIIEDGTLIGYISSNDLAHCLEIAERECMVHAPFSLVSLPHDDATSLSDSFLKGFMYDVNSLSRYIDKAPLAVNVNCPVDLVLEMFKKLGIKTLLVTSKGRYVGTIYKKRILSMAKKID